MGDFRDSPLGGGNLGFVNTGSFEFGDLETAGDRDVFQMQLIDGLTYTLEQRGTGGSPLVDPELFLVDVFDTVITSNDDGGPGLNSLIDHTATFTGAHYLSARDYQENDTGEYRVIVSAGRGTNGGDNITGTGFADAVEALGGVDTVNGAGGEDILYGGNGDDTIRGGTEDDFIDGGRDEDTVRGQEGADLLSGGFEADIVIGGSGNDTFFYNFVSGSAPGARDTFRAGDGGAAFDNPGNANGDKFDLINIDADTSAGAGGNQAFLFGGVAQTGKGRIWLSNSGSDTIVHGNTDNDAADEWQVEIEDGAGATASSYTAADFFL